MGSCQVEGRLKVGFLISSDDQALQGVETLLDVPRRKAPAPLSREQGVTRLQVPELRHSAPSSSRRSSPPGNRLETLSGDRRGQRSIRINDQWRICFVWREGNAYQVEIVDYH